MINVSCMYPLHRGITFLLGKLETCLIGQYCIFTTYTDGSYGASFVFLVRKMYVSNELQKINAVDASAMKYLTDIFRPF